MANGADEMRVIELETRLTYQEAAMQELSDALAHQQKVIDRLGAELDALRQQVRAQAQFNIASSSEETPPPHY